MVRSVALLLLWVLLPGAAEVTENLTHLLVHGHLAHAQMHRDGHRPAGAEHGCAGPSHICPCHASIPFELTRAVKVAAPQAALRASEAPSPRTLGRSRPPLDQPPRT